MDSKSTLEQPKLDKSAEIFNKIFSHPYLAFIGLLLLFYFLSSSAATGLSNSDTYFHLRVGQEFISGGWKPWNSGHFNDFDNAEWISTQWLSQVGMAAVYNVGGLELLVWLSAIIFIAFAFSIYYILRNYATPPIAFILTLGYVLASLAIFSLRPQLISFFLILLTTHMWLQAQKSGKIPWAAIPIFFLWPNLHGMWIAGLINVSVLALAFAGQRGFRENKKALLVPLFSLIATFCTPMGPRIWQGVIGINSLATGGGWSEWGPPDYTEIHYFLAFLMMLATIGFMCWKKTSTPMEIALLLLAIGWALYSQRSAPFAILMFLPLLAPMLSADLPKVPRTRRETVIVSTLALLALIPLISMPANPTRGLGLDPWVKTVMAKLPDSTVVYTDSSSGAYFLQAQPKLNIFIHGYADAFTPEEVNRLQSLLSLKPGWPAILKDTGATYALFPNGSQVAYALQLDDWKVVRSDPRQIFLKAPPDWLTNKSCVDRALLKC